MAKAPSAASKISRRSAAAPAAGPKWQWLTNGGLLLAAALVAARMLMSEPLKQSLGNPVPGTTGAPLGPGPATGLVLDLLCWIPAFAVLLRQLLDSRYRLRRTGAFAVMGLLGLLAIASMAWSADKFSAIVGAFHLLSAMILLWSAAQSARSWLHLRCVAGIAAGLLLALAVKGYTDHFVEQPMVRANWESQKKQVMQENHWGEDSFELRQFEKRVMSGQAMGFSQSPNTYAGLLVLLGTVATGLILDRMFKPPAGERRGPGIPDTGEARRIGKIDSSAATVLEYESPHKYPIPPAWALALLAAVGLCVPLIRWTQCRAAYATPVLTAAGLAVIGWKRRWLAEHAKSAFLFVTAAIVAGFAAIAGWGIARGNLIHSSLTFRWWYWIGSARIIRSHPLLGVGWGNFAASYLGVRLPIASEEIIDPHNFFMRFFTELGAVGGGLLLIWLAWTAWKLTAGATGGLDTAAADDAPPRWGWRGRILAIPVLALGINLLASVDFGQSGDFIILEATNRLFWLVAMVAGMAVALVRRGPGGRGQIVLELESAPGPWTVRAIVVGLGIFLVHNLIEFGIFEPGAMLLVALLCGTALGVRLRAGVCDPGLYSSAKGQALRIAVLAGGIGAWVAAAVLLVAPVALAEGLAERGDDLIRADRPAEAEAAMESAARWCPYNAEYLVRSATAARLRRPPVVAGAKALLSRAVAVDPLYIDPLLMRAQLELITPASPASIEDAITDYRRALAIDPNNVRLRIELADLLSRLGQSTSSAGEYQRALQLNDALEIGDPKRLSRQEIEHVRQSLKG